MTIPESKEFTGESGDLFRAAERLDASLNLDQAVRGALGAAMKQTDRSRAQIADDISRLTGQKVTLRMLDDFTAESKSGYRFPAAWLAAFCVATRDSRVLQVIVEKCGYRVITPEEAMLIELATNYLTKKKATERLESLETRLARKGGAR
jgi:hypothetical protein